MSESNSTPEITPKIRFPTSEKGKELYWNNLKKEEKDEEKHNERVPFTTRHRIARKRTADQLLTLRAQEKAGKDSLTEINNTRGFNEALSRTIADFKRHNSNRTLTFLAIDVDDLKITNDSGGHHAGDNLLKDVANALVKSGRETNIYGRTGGDEFSVALLDADEAEAIEYSKRLKAALGENQHVSIGIAKIDYSSPEMVTSSKDGADLAMYWSKTRYKEGLGDEPILAGNVPLEYIMDPKKLQMRAKARKVVEYGQKAS